MTTISPHRIAKTPSPCPECARAQIDCGRGRSSGLCASCQAWEELVASLGRDGPDLLARNAILPHLESIGRYEAICEMVDALSRAGRVNDQLQESIVKALLLDEDSVSTAIDGQMAILHVTHPAVSTPVATVARSRHGVELSVHSSTRTTVMVLLATPPERPATRLRLVAMIARHLREFDKRSSQLERR